ncbi:MAG TPA: hypothetical protein ACHBX0_05735 [Arsenophonus sp.]
MEIAKHRITFVSLAIQTELSLLDGINRFLLVLIFSRSIFFSSSNNEADNTLQCSTISARFYSSVASSNAINVASSFEEVEDGASSGLSITTSGFCLNFSARSRRTSLKESHLFATGAILNGFSTKLIFVPER